MPERSPFRFVWFAACAAVFIWISSRGMPDVVASHFEADGYANGFMKRGPYVGVMFAVAAVLPTLLVLAMHYSLGRPNARINLPNRDYWLAPERREETVSYLRGRMATFAAALMAFLCYVHWLVVRANRVQPPHLSSAWINAGIAAFMIFAILWTRMLLRRFRARPPGR